MTIAPPQEVPAQAVTAFETLALKLKNSGHAKYSARTILHVMRWHRDIAKDGREYKINDHWSAPLSRWFMAKHGCHEFFETREKTS